MAKTFTPGTARWLSAAGHPGFSPASAAKVLAHMTGRGLDPANPRHVSAAAFEALR